MQDKKDNSVPFACTLGRGDNMVLVGDMVYVLNADQFYYFGTMDHFLNCYGVGS